MDPVAEVQAMLDSAAAAMGPVLFVIAGGLLNIALLVFGVRMVYRSIAGSSRGGFAFSGYDDEWREDGEWNAWGQDDDHGGASCRCGSGEAARYCCGIGV